VSSSYISQGQLGPSFGCDFRETEGREEKRVGIESRGSPFLLAGFAISLQWGGVSDQKTSKFFVFHQEKSMAGHMGVNGVY
jgi:hypothetical protein